MERDFKSKNTERKINLTLIICLITIASSFLFMHISSTFLFTKKINELQSELDYYHRVDALRDSLNMDHYWKSLSMPTHLHDTSFSDEKTIRSEIKFHWVKIKASTDTIYNIKISDSILIK